MQMLTTHVDNPGYSWAKSPSATSVTGSIQRLRTDLVSRNLAMDQKVVPVTCPIAWSAGGRRRHSRTTPQGRRPVSPHPMRLGAPWLGAVILTGPICWARRCPPVWPTRRGAPATEDRKVRGVWGRQLQGKVGPRSLLIYRPIGYATGTAHRLPCPLCVSTRPPPGLSRGT